MPRRKKSTVAGVLRGFHFDQPFIGFHTSFQTLPLQGKLKKEEFHTMHYGGSCREELVWDTREFLQGKTISWKTERGTWKRTPSLNRTINLDHPKLKQPLVTYLWVNDEEDWEGNMRQVCKRPCCLGTFPELLDALVGPVVVALNPDRYEGDWWTTSLEEALPKKHMNELRWYGTDNFFLRHPVLTSLVMGMFRQAILLHEQGFDEAILKAVGRKDVEECLTNGDPALALRILTAVKPWVAVPSRFAAANFSFPALYWHRLAQLQKAIYKYGYEEVFGKTIHDGWGLASAENRYAVSNGPMAYWGTTGSKVTAAGKILAKLGK